MVPTPGVVFILHDNPPPDEVVEKLGGPSAPKPAEVEVQVQD